MKKRIEIFKGEPKQIPTIKEQTLLMENEELKREIETLRAGIIRTLKIPIGAVLDQSTRFVLTDALKAGEANYENVAGIMPHKDLADTQESGR